MPKKYTVKYFYKNKRDYRDAENSVKEIVGDENGEKEIYIKVYDVETGLQYRSCLILKKP